MLNIAVLVYVAIFEQFMIVLGRYLYMSQLALAVVLYAFLRNAERSAVSVRCVGQSDVRRPPALVDSGLIKRLPPIAVAHPE